MSRMFDDLYSAHIDEEDYLDHYDDYLVIRERRDRYYESCNDTYGEIQDALSSNDFGRYKTLTRRSDDFCAETGFDDDLECQWRTIDNFSNYRIYEDGRIVSYVKNGKPKQLRTWKNNYGHLYVQLTNDFGERRKLLVHRLVATAFKPNNKKYPVVMHKDDNPKNNTIKNLKWGTVYDNVHDCIDKERNYTKRVYCFDTDKVYRSCADAAEDLGVSRSLITVCCQGKVHSVKGMIFCYLDDKDKITKKDILMRRAASRGTKPVAATNRKTGERIIFKSRQEASAELNVSGCSISSCVNGYLGHCGDWIFSNVSEEEYYG